MDAFELWYWRRLLRVPCPAGRSNQSILKEISPRCSLEGLMLKLKLQYFGHLMQRCHPIISSSVIPSSSCPQSFPASGSFQMSQLFASAGQNIGFSFNISSSNEHPGLISFRMDQLDLLAGQGTLKSLL